MPTHFQRGGHNKKCHILLSQILPYV
jgi:hypothetical protein